MIKESDFYFQRQRCLVVKAKKYFKKITNDCSKLNARWALNICIYYFYGTITNSMFLVWKIVLNSMEFQTI